MPESVRRSIAELELTYYLPCSARGRTIAYLGVSRTDSGDFFRARTWNCWSLCADTSASLSITRSIPVAGTQGGRVRTVKEFSENIVESINVGILAADLEDRVGSWNSQIEKLTGSPGKCAWG